jgi:cytochrome c
MNNLRKSFYRVAIAVVGAALASAAQAAGNAGNGAVVFNRCAICHDNTKSGPNKIGPELFGVVGRKAGTYPGFSYSGAMQKAGFMWTPDRLDAYIASPATVVPGNKMTFAGIANASQRADLIAFLGTLK